MGRGGETRRRYSLPGAPVLAVMRAIACGLGQFARQVRPLDPPISAALDIAAAAIRPRDPGIDETVRHIKTIAGARPLFAGKAERERPARISDLNPVLKITAWARTNPVYAGLMAVGALVALPTLAFFAGRAVGRRA